MLSAADTVMDVPSIPSTAPSRASLPPSSRWRAGPNVPELATWHTAKASRFVNGWVLRMAGDGEKRMI